MPPTLSRESFGRLSDGTPIGTIALQGEGGPAHRQPDAIRLEPDACPDARNRPDFFSSRLDPGKPYGRSIIKRRSVT